MAGPAVKRCRTELHGKAVDWNYIPDLVLIEIFEMLPFKDMQNCRSVCLKWCEILNERRFAEKFKLNIDECLIDIRCPPWSVLNCSSRKSINLSIGRNTYNTNYFWPFWKRISRDVEDLVICGIRPLQGVLMLFHKLKTLRLLSGEDLLIFKDWIPLITELIIVQTPLDPYSNNEIKKALDELKLRENLKSILSPTRKHCEEIEAWMETYPKNLLDTETIDFSDIIEADFDANTIQKLVNLQTLKLELWGDGGCFFTHDKVLLSKVKNIYFDIVLIDFPENSQDAWCKSCIENLIVSFPEWDSSTFNCERVPIQKLQELINSTPKPLKYLHLSCDIPDIRINLNFPALEKLTFYLHVTTQSPPSLHEICVMPNLKHLGVYGPTKINLDIKTIKEIVEKAPAMESVHLTEITVEKLLVMESGWPDIKKITFRHEFNQRQEISLLSQLNGKFKKLVEFGSTPYESRCLYTHFHIQLFEKIPTLRGTYAMKYADFCKHKYNLTRDCFEFYRNEIFW